VPGLGAALATYRSGTFEYWFQNPQQSAFSQMCQDQLLTLRYAADSDRPMAERFTNQPGVSVTIPDYGRTQSAPFYEPMFQRLEAAGYVRNHSIRVAGYDARLTPDIGDFLARSKKLIEQTSAENGGRPVHVVGHSNGPLYIQYLLTHTSREWRDRFIQGFTPIAGNFPGQGSLYSILFTGLNIIDFSLPSEQAQARTSARLYLTNPSTYMSAADPEVFGRQEIVLRNSTTGKEYTPADYRQLLADAGLQRLRPIADHYIGFVEFTDRAHFPYVDVYAEKGSGIDTQIGAILPNLTVGQVVDPNTQLILAPGDINQEDITNNAVSVWQAMQCFHFSLTDNPGVNHFELPSNSEVLARLVADTARQPSECSRGDANPQR
jgi:lecithin-cholesterol acyltransferase